MRRILADICYLDSRISTMAKILITGGTGLVGRTLSKLLHEKGHQIVHLSRSANSSVGYTTYQWDIDSQYIDEKAFTGVEYIIHLAGAGVADKRWTEARKKVIIDSRVDSIKLLKKYVEELQVPLRQFISASAIGYYGMDTGSQLLTEDSSSGSDYLAEVVKLWEEEADEFDTICPVSKIRIGVVLSSNGGAMREILKPIQWLVGAPLGSGKQVMSWIHIDDLVRIFEHVLDHELSGIYNAVAPNPVSNEALTKTLAKAVNKPLWLPNVPAFTMKLLLGEMSQIVLGGNHVSAKKIQSTGFKFLFYNIEESVNDLVG